MSLKAVSFSDLLLNFDLMLASSLLILFRSASFDLPEGDNDIRTRTVLAQEMWLAITNVHKGSLQCVCVGGGGSQFLMSDMKTVSPRMFSPNLLDMTATFDSYLWCVRVCVCVSVGGHSDTIDCCVYYNRA